MTLDSFIIDLALILIVASIMALIFKKIKLPVVLGYIVAGFLISPNFSWLPTVVDTADIETWADIGIIFLMFALGLEFSFTKLADMGSSAIVTALTVISGMIATGYLVGTLLGFASMDKVFLGCMISMSSTMIILKAYEEYGVKKEPYAGLVLGTLVVEDICGIFMMIILSAVSVSKGVSGIQLGLHIGKLLVMLVVWVLLGVYIIPSLVKKIKKLMNKELLLIVSLGICFGMVIISHLIGFSEALGAFMAGSILAGTTSGENIEKVVKPLKDLFGAVFFVSVGMMVVPSLLVKYLVPIIIITLVTIFGQMFFATLGMVLSGQNTRTAIMGGFSMVQIGEFSFIIAALGKSLGVIGPQLYPIIVCVSIISIFTTPIFMKSSGKFYTFAKKHCPKTILAFLNKYTSERRNMGDNNSLWKQYLVQYSIRTIVTSSLLFVFFSIGSLKLIPFLEKHLSSGSHIVACIIVIGLMTPIINIMINGKNAHFKQLWLVNPTNRLPLMVLKTINILISGFFIIWTLNEYLAIKFYYILPICLVVIFFIVKSTFLKGQAIHVEAKFFANFNEKILMDKKLENDEIWTGDRLEVVQIKINDNLKEPMQLEQLTESRFIDILVIKIIHENKHIVLPTAKEEIRSGDILFALIGKNELDGYKNAFSEMDIGTVVPDSLQPLRSFIYGQKEENVTLEHQIVCNAIPITKETGLVGKSIKRSDFRAKYGGSVVAIERENMIIENPNIDTMLRDDDLMWVIGNQDMAIKLIEDGLISG